MGRIEKFSSGIGGGVAITALQLCVAKGANVYVTSGDEEKIAKAVKLGAKGGVNYKDRKRCPPRHAVDNCVLTPPSLHSEVVPGSRRTAQEEWSKSIGCSD